MPDARFCFNVWARTCQRRLRLFNAAADWSMAWADSGFRTGAEASMGTGKEVGDVFSICGIARKGQMSYASIDID